MLLWCGENYWQYKAKYHLYMETSCCCQFIGKDSVIMGKTLLKWGWLMFDLIFLVGIWDLLTSVSRPSHLCEYLPKGASWICITTIIHDVEIVLGYSGLIEKKWEWRQVRVEYIYNSGYMHVMLKNVIDEIATFLNIYRLHDDLHFKSNL